MTLKIQLISAKSACKILSISRSTFYRVQKQDATFPKPICVSQKRKAWRQNELEEWLDSKS